MENIFRKSYDEKCEQLRENCNWGKKSFPFAHLKVVSKTSLTAFPGDKIIKNELKIAKKKEYCILYKPG